MTVGRVTIVIALQLLLTVAPAMSQAPNVPLLFDLANKGQLDDAVRQAVTSFADIRDLDRDIRRTAPAWIAREGTTAAPHRRLVVATFVLALGRAVYQQVEAQLAEQTHLPPSLYPSAGFTDEGRAAWPRLRPLLEWACSLVRSDPTPLDQEWLVASVSLFKDFGDTDEAVRNGLTSLYGVPTGHLAHALKEFPADPWLRLIMAERHTGAEIGVVTSWATLPRGYDADLKVSRQALLALEPEVSVRAHVHEHLGRIAATLGDLNLAHRYFAQMAGETQNACLVCMGNILTAVIDDRQGRLREAEAGYRRALGVFPGAGAASTALAALLWTDGRTTEATALVRATRASVPPADDPWMTAFHVSECSDWAELMAPLRAALR